MIRISSLYINLWSLSFIITKFNAKQWGVLLLQTFYIYSAKITVATVELFWWRTVGQKIDRLAWSADFGETNHLVLRDYDVLNKRACVLIGCPNGNLPFVGLYYFETSMGWYNVGTFTYTLSFSLLCMTISPKKSGRSVNVS